MLREWIINEFLEDFTNYFESFRSVVGSMFRKIRFRVHLNNYEDYGWSLMPRDKHSKNYVPVNVKNNRISLAKVFKQFKTNSLLEITIKEIKTGKTPI